MKKKPYGAQASVEYMLVLLLSLTLFLVVLKTGLGPRIRKLGESWAERIEKQWFNRDSLHHLRIR